MDWILLPIGIFVGIHLERWRRHRADRAREASLASLNAFAASYKGAGATARELPARTPPPH